MCNETELLSKSLMYNKSAFSAPKFKMYKCICLRPVFLEQDFHKDEKIRKGYWAVWIKHKKDSWVQSCECSYSDSWSLKSYDCDSIWTRMRIQYCVKQVMLIFNSKPELCCVPMHVILKIVSEKNFSCIMICTFYTYFWISRSAWII